MSEYIKQHFEPGQILTAAQLNHIEDGIEKILPVIETGEAKQLVTDAEGNLLWEKKVLDYTVEDMTLFSGIILTGESNQYISDNAAYGPFLEVEEGTPATVIIDGTSYNTVVTANVTETRTIFSIEATINNKALVVRFMRPDVTVNIINAGKVTGTMSITVKVKNYQKIDLNYLPLPSKQGEAFNTAKLTNHPDAKAEGVYSVVANAGQTSGLTSFSANYGVASGHYSFANGFYSEAKGLFSHAEGSYTIASGENQHTEGKYNVEDAEEKYAHIIGNGTSDSARSNAHTIDWQGNGWFAGTMEGTGVIVKSSTEGSNKRFMLTVDDSGTISAREVVE